jgi:membrane protease YdiL (CAAX protease family)
MTALVNLAILFVLLASVHLWILALLRTWTQRSVQAVEPPTETPWGLSDILMAIVLQMVVHSAAHEWFRRRGGLPAHFELPSLGIERSSTYVGIMAIASVAALTLTIGWLLARHRPSLSEFGIRIRSIGLDAVLGVRSFVMLAPVIYGIQFVLVQFVESEHPLIEMLKKNPSSRFFVISGFAAVIVAPLVEEFFFRLLLQGWLERLATRTTSSWRIFFGGRSTVHREPTEQLIATTDSASPSDQEKLSDIQTSENSATSTPTPRKPRWPIVVSALLFGLAHASNGPDPVPLFVLALGLGHLYRSTGRILPSIIVHVLLNGTTLGMMWFVLKQSP